MNLGYEVFTGCVSSLRVYLLYLAQSLEELQRNYKEKEKLYNNLSSLDEMQAKLGELQNHMAWALVRSGGRTAPKASMTCYVFMFVIC